MPAGGAARDPLIPGDRHGVAVVGVHRQIPGLPCRELACFQAQRSHQESTLLSVTIEHTLCQPRKQNRRVTTLAPEAWGRVG